jgi:hypothetical protein
MAEVIGTPGAVVDAAGVYGCSECGHRVTLSRGDTFPPAHHPEKPWTLMVADDGPGNDARAERSAKEKVG